MRGGPSNLGSSKENESHHSPMKLKIKMKKILDPWGPYVPMWNTIFLVSAVIAVSMDPLLLYIPVLDEENKCVRSDANLKIIALILRWVCDLSYLVHIGSKIRTGLSQRKGLANNTPWETARRIYWPSILVDVLAVLPIPEVIFLDYFPKMWSWRSFISAELISFFVLVQYMPRVLRVYLSCEKLKRTPRVDSRTVWFKIKVSLIFLLYAVASHIAGAVWYFYSIQRVTACWHHVCQQRSGCVPSDFVCGRKHTSADMHFLYGSCRTNPPKTDFEFGIFSDAVQSGILETKTSIVTRFVRCYWWGLRNISSFGQNLQTSTDLWETCFAASICITALILLIYLIGNLQMYLQMATTRSEDIVKRMRWIEEEIDIWIRRYYLPEDERTLIIQNVEQLVLQDDHKGCFDLRSLRSLLLDRFERINDNVVEKLIHPKGITTLEARSRSEDKTQQGYTIKEQEAVQWMSINGIPDQIRLKIMPHVRSKLLQENEDVDLKTMLSILPRECEMSIKRHLCFSVLKKVPMLRDLDDDEIEKVYDYLKPVIYPEKSYIIQQGEPLDLMFIVTKGIAWTYTASNIRGEVSISAASYLERGDFFGDKELREWTLNNTSLSNIPISATNVKAHTKVEALALMAKDFRDLFSSSSNGSSSSGSRTIEIKVD